MEPILEGIALFWRMGRAKVPGSSEIKTKEKAAPISNFL